MKNWTRAKAAACIVWAGLAAGCGESEEVKAARLAQAAEEHRVQRLAAAIEARHENDCTNLLKAQAMADLGVNMGLAAGRADVAVSAQNLKETAGRKYEECERGRKEQVASEVAAVRRWGAQKTQILARAAALAAAKDWRGLKSLYNEYAANDDPALGPLLAQAKALEAEYDREWWARQDQEQFARTSGQLNAYRVLSQQARRVAEADPRPEAVQAGAPHYMECRRSAIEVEKLERAERAKGELPSARTIPDVYVQHPKDCAEQARQLCAGPDASPACTTTTAAESRWPEGPQPDAALDDATWKACEADAACNDVFAAADAWCTAYVEAVRNLDDSSMRQVLTVLALESRADSDRTRETLSQMSLVGRQMGARLGKMLWRDNRDEKGVWQACDDLMRVHPVVHRLLPALIAR